MDNELIAARDAFEPEDFALAANLLLPTACSGYVVTQYLLGFLYCSSPEQHLAQSRHWIVLASTLHHADALFHLSTFYDDVSTCLPDCLHRGLLLLKAAQPGSLLTKRGYGCYQARGERGFSHDHCLGGFLSSGLWRIGRAIEQEEEAG